MQLFAIVPLLAILLRIGVVQARPLGTELNLNVVQIGHGALGARQATIPEVPAECKSTCDPVNTVISDDVSACRYPFILPPLIYTIISQMCPLTATACCSASFETGWFNCFKCVGVPLGVTNYTTPQQTIDGEALSTQVYYSISMPLSTHHCMCCSRIGTTETYLPRTG
jgi:hypothetical protein